MDFGDVEYWERFYRRYMPSAKPPGEGEAATGADRGGGAEQQLEQYEWYFEASALVPRLLPCLPSLAEEGQLPAVLMLGCGSSRLSELLYEAGYHHITNVDFSPLVIASMQEKTRSTCPTLQWLVADVTHMPAIASSRWPPPLTFLSGA
jgi:SAM-dependent methyltransferase